MRPSEYALSDPIVAIATALVPSALAIVRTSGAGCVDLVAGIFSRPKALRDARGNSLVHGWIVATNPGSASAEPQKIDEVVLAVYKAPASFTGEDSVEVMCHGGTATVLAVYRALVGAGFRAAERGEFTFRAFSNGRTDLARSEAIAEIIGAETDAARARAAGRLSGNLSEAIAETRNLALKSLASIEVEIEYPEEEDATSRSDFDAEPLRAAAARLAELESSWTAEKLFQDGARVVLAGKTNAGKSSLFNALLKEDRAIVSDVHGTTRDWIEAAADFGGIPVRIIDTAGLRATDDAIEAKGVERARELAQGADLVLYVVDATVGIDGEDRAFLDAPDAGVSRAPIIIVWNKADRPDAKEEAFGAGDGSSPKTVRSVSARLNTGIAELVAEARTVLLGSADEAKASRSVGLGTERQRNAVRNARAGIDRALDAAEAGFPMDAVAQDIEDALIPLGEITGEITSADVLDAVFSGFCVGK